jgi:PEP-CTERM motif
MNTLIAKRHLVAAAVASALSSASWGATTIIGTPLDVLGSITVPTLVYTTGTSFSDVIKFSVSTSSNVDTDIVSALRPGVGIDFTGITLQNSASTVLFTTDPAPTNNYFYSFPSLAAGSYTLTIAGIATGTPNGGRYSVDLYATPVPEPLSASLVLAGLGVAAWSSVRHRKA